MDRKRRIALFAVCAFLLFLTISAPGTAAQSRKEGIVKGEKGTPLFISPATLRVLEQRLNQNGYNAGDVNGEWDGWVEQALTGFQRSQRLEPTGNVNLETLHLLGISPAGPRQAGVNPTRDAALSGVPLYISPAGIRKIEQKLNEEGHDPGKIDGQWDRVIRNAIRGFEQARGLEPTGNINLNMLKRLGLDQLIAGLSDRQQEQARGEQPGQPRGYFGENRKEPDRQAREGERKPPAQAAISGISQGTGAPLFVSPTGVRLIQKSLVSAGYDTNGIDGIWGKGTASAVRDWQQANGLEPTGNLNVQTADKLGVF